MRPSRLTCMAVVGRKGKAYRLLRLNLLAMLFFQGATCDECFFHGDSRLCPRGELTESFFNELVDDGEDVTSGERIGDASGELCGELDGELSMSPRLPSWPRSSICAVRDASTEIADIFLSAPSLVPRMLVRAATADELRGEGATCSATDSASGLCCEVAFRYSRRWWTRVLSLDACFWMRLSLCPSSGTSDACARSSSSCPTSHLGSEKKWRTAQVAPTTTLGSGLPIAVTS